MRLAHVTLLAALAACGTKATSVASGSTPGIDEDERGSVGVPPGAVGYCTYLGYTPSADGACVFTDGTSCELWAFFYGQCGQAHSYCNQRGGSLSSRSEDAGTFTGIFAVCAIDGKECYETDFVRSAKCE